MNAPHKRLSTAATSPLMLQKTTFSQVYHKDSIKKHDLPITPALSSVSAFHQTPPLIFDRQPCQNVPPGPTNKALTLIYRERSEKKTIQSEQLHGTSSPGFMQGLMDLFVTRFLCGGYMSAQA